MISLARVSSWEKIIKYTKYIKVSITLNAFMFKNFDKIFESSGDRKLKEKSLYIYSNNT